MKSLPIVAIIGQTNAGKSSLFNRLLRRREAIVAREEGTTRDNVAATIDNQYLLIDTAGLKDPTDQFEASIRDQIEDAIASADLILLTLDSSKYTNHKDKEIAKKALRSGTPTLLVLNKSDLSGSLPDNEFRSLGIPHILRVSATTGHGTDHLKSTITKTLQSPDTILTKQSLKDDVETLRIALIGRPNVGKSSLFNTLAQKQQALTSSQQGTTRDINRVDIKYKGQTLQILDTAGLRRQGKREVGIEKFSALRTLAAIEESDLCCLLIDSTEPHSKLDQTLAGQIINAGKGIILIVTKTDLLAQNPPDSTLGGLTEDLGWSAPSSVSKRGVHAPTSSPTAATAARKDGPARARSAEDRPTQILRQLEQDFNFIPYAPVILTSSTTGQNVTKIFELAQTIQKTQKQTLKTSDLNRILTEATLEHQPAGLKNTRPKLRYITQTDTCPPWFVVYGSDLQLLHWSYKRFLERKIREYHPFIGTPIKFSFKNRD